LNSCLAGMTAQILLASKTSTLIVLVSSVAEPLTTWITNPTVSAACYLTIAKKVSFGTIKMKGVNASNSTNALAIIILIIILVNALVKLKTTLIAQKDNTGVTLIAHANASLKCSLAP